MELCTYGMVVVLYCDEVLSGERRQWLQIMMEAGAL